MTWQLNFSGHLDDPERQAKVALFGQVIAAQLEAFGLSYARFYDGMNSVDYLEPEVPAEEQTVTAADVASLDLRDSEE